MSGGGGGGQSGEVQQAQPQQVYQEPVYQQQPQQQACQMELKQFIECTQTQNDISMCQGYNEVLKDCKIRFGRSNKIATRKQISYNFTV
jgi:ubiquitin carboxyl-terminal hydrolase 6/32